MKNFNVTIIQPPGFTHSLALQEVAEYLCLGLRECGASAEPSINRIDAAARNVILCAHLLPEREHDLLPPDSIIFNSEQLNNANFWQLFQARGYGRLLERFTVWDYSLQNLDRLPHNRTALIPLLFSRGLVRPGIRRDTGTCLCFYGAMTDRRKSIIRGLAAAGIPVKIMYGKYGRERDAQFSDAWAILNLRTADDVTTFEPVRCFYPLINRIPVISESAPGDPTFSLYERFLFSFGIDSLVDGAHRLWNARQEFETAARRKLDDFALTSAAAAFRQAIGQFVEQGNR